MTLLFDELRRLLINSGSPGQTGPFDEAGRLLVTDSHKSTSTGGALPAATTTAAGAVRAATAAESEQATGRVNLAWSVNKLRALFGTAIPSWINTAAELLPNGKLATGTPNAGDVPTATADGRVWSAPAAGRGAPVTLANMSVPANVVNGGTIAIPLSSPMVPGQLLEIIIQDGSILPDLAGGPLVPSATILSTLRPVTATPTASGTAGDFISYEVHRGTNSSNMRTGFSHAAIYVGRADESTLVLGHSHWTTFDNTALAVQVFAH